MTSITSHFTKRLDYECSKPSCNARVQLGDKEGFIFDKAMGGRLLKACVDHRKLSIEELLN